MYNLQNIHHRKAFRSYVKERMMESLISGVPEIASSESSFKRTVKSLMFLLCTAGFFYQSYVFTETFLKYETVQNMRIEHPTKLMAPAVTFCNKNRISRPRFCTGLKEKCFWINESTEYYCRRIDPKLCNRDMFHRDDVVLAVPLNISDTYNSSNEFLDAYGPLSPREFFQTHRTTKHLSHCHLEINGGIEKCRENDSILIQVPSNGLPYKCLTIYSLFDKPNEEPRTLRLSDGYFFWLWKHPEQYMDSKHNFPIYMSVHDPRRLVNPIVEGNALHGGTRYTISFSMKQSQTLPPPYDSNCVDYVSNWKKNGGRGPLTKKDCLELCKIERMMEKHSCVGKSITYPHRLPICSKNQSISDKVIEECSSGCREACDAILYEVITNYKRGIIPDKKHNDQFIQVALKFGQLYIQRTFLEPKFQDIELFSYIGGFMGLWLGISFITFIDFVETVTDIVTFSALRWKKMRGEKNIRHRFPH